MKILHVITTLDIGGAERLMVDLLPRLKRKGDRVDLLLFNGEHSSFRDELYHEGIEVFELSCVKGYADHREVYNPMNILRLMKHLRHYDIIHTHNTACQFFVPLAKSISCAKNKLVTTEHSTSNRRRTLNWFKMVDRWMYSRYDSIICVSKQAELNLDKYLGSDHDYHCITIPNGVNTERFFIANNDHSHTETFTVTMIAAFREEKDHPTLLKAMALLPDSYRLLLVGDGVTAPRLRKMCQEMNLTNRVTFLGFRCDVPEILRDSDVVVLSSRWEGFGLAAVEAMASARPLIASDVGGLRDVVSGAGLLFPLGDEHALASSIRKLRENPEYYAKVATACLERAKMFDISVMAEKYLKLYDSLLYNDSKV